MDKVLIYRSRRIGERNQWRWRYVAGGNHKRLAGSGESYTNLDDLLSSLATVVGLDQAALLDRGLVPGWSGTFYRKGQYDRVRIEVKP